MKREMYILLHKRRRELDLFSLIKCDCSFCYKERPDKKKDYWSLKITLIQIKLGVICFRNYKDCSEAVVLEEQRG